MFARAQVSFRLNFATIDYEKSCQKDFSIANVDAVMTIELCLSSKSYKTKVKVNKNRTCFCLL